MELTLVGLQNSGKTTLVNVIAVSGAARVLFFLFFKKKTAGKETTFFLVVGKYSNPSTACPTCLAHVLEENKRQRDIKKEGEDDVSCI